MTNYDVKQVFVDPVMRPKNLPPGFGLVAKSLHSLSLYREECDSSFFKSKN